MSKLKNNPIMKGASGMLGNVVVYREQKNGKLIMANRPKKRDELTDHQKIQKSRFLQAVQYAKAQMADPLSKAEYETGINDKINSAYAAAMTDYLRGPEILEVNTSAYQGQISDKVLLNVFDNFKVTAVDVEIRTALDVLLEKGPAIQEAFNPLLWVYTTTVANNVLPGTKIIVRASDKPGNVTVMELVL